MDVFMDVLHYQGTSALASLVNLVACVYYANFYHRCYTLISPVGVTQ